MAEGWRRTNPTTGAFGSPYGPSLRSARALFDTFESTQSTSNLANQNTPTGDVNRAYQTTLKDAINAANNASRSR